MSFPTGQRKRLLSELRALRARFPTILLCEDHPEPLVEGLVETATGPKRYRLKWPPEFPFRPPLTWELSLDGAEIIDHGAHGFVFEDRSLCLFAHDPRTGWRPEYTAGDALERLVTYLEQEGRGVFPRVEHATLTVRILRLSIPPVLATELQSGGGWGMWSGRGREDLRLLRVESVDGTSPSPVISGAVRAELNSPWMAALGLSRSVQGLWCRLDKTVAQLPVLRHDLEAWVQHQLPNEHARRLHGLHSSLLLVLKDGLRFLGKRMESSSAARPSIGMVFIEPDVEDIEECVFKRVDAHLERAAIQGAQAALVGLGSLGGSIAVALAKAGVARFVLIDPDSLAPENVARHVGGLGEIGVPKVEVVGRAIHRVNPSAEVVQVPAALALDPAGWGLDSTRHLLDVIQNPRGVVVCTTAAEHSERVVNHLCVAHGAAGVFASVLGRAQHGRVFRVLPGATACYQCVLSAQHSHPGRFPRFDQVDVGVPAYLQPGIPGLGLDVEQVALIAARMTLQTLGERSGSNWSYPQAHGDHLLWSNHGGWAVDGPLQARVEHIPRDSSCPVCGSEVERHLTPEEEQELAALQRHAPQRS